MSTAIAGANLNAMKPIKKTLRSNMKSTLKALSPEHVSTASTECCRRLQQTEQYRRSQAICCYLSMANEIQTYALIREAFQDGKHVYIPRVVGPNSGDMVVIQLESFEQIDTFPRSKWGIPEPSEEYIARVQDVSGAAVLDLIFVPGVAFDRKGGRIGHGKGYYDCFLSKNRSACIKEGKPPASTIGIGFDEQLIEDVPMTEMDVTLSAIITPSFQF